MRGAAEAIRAGFLARPFATVWLRLGTRIATPSARNDKEEGLAMMLSACHCEGQSPVAISVGGLQWIVTPLVCNDKEGSNM